MNKKPTPSSYKNDATVSDLPLTESDYIKIKEGMQEFRKTFKFRLRKFKL